MNIAQNVWRWFLGQVRNWVTWGSKTSHRAKSAENLVNTLAVTFLKQSSWILLKMFVLMSSRLSSKLGHLGSKTRTPRQSAENLVNTLGSHFWNTHHESCSKCLSWWFLGQARNWVAWGQKLGHQAKSADSSGHMFQVIIMNHAQIVCLDDF